MSVSDVRDLSVALNLNWEPFRAAMQRLARAVTEFHAAISVSSHRAGRHNFCLPASDCRRPRPMPFAADYQRKTRHRNRRRR